MKSEPKVSILFVCMGNICRSPTAEGVFRKFVVDADLADEIFTDSAGTHAYHSGEPADRRARAAAADRGYSLEGISARQVTVDDYDRFDYILAMDEDNLMELTARAPATTRCKVGLFLEYATSQPENEVPDPYYGGTAGFERVLDLIEEASRGFLETLRKDL